MNSILFHFSCLERNETRIKRKKKTKAWKGKILNNWQISIFVHFIGKNRKREREWKKENGMFLFLFSTSIWSQLNQMFLVSYNNCISNLKVFVCFCFSFFNLLSFRNPIYLHRDQMKKQQQMHISLFFFPIHFVFVYS